MKKINSENLKDNISNLIDLIDRTKQMILAHTEAKSPKSVITQYKEIKERYIAEITELVKVHYKIPLVA